ncbi:MAG: hypothetical protein QM764_20310 [Chitinophagaceae bacterium]
MKSLTVVVVIIAAILSTFYFSKPSDIRCRDAAMKIVTNDLTKVPGYSDPNAVNISGATAESDKVLISDRVLWKDISYVYPSSVKKIGTAYLGSFHANKK